MSRISVYIHYPNKLNESFQVDYDGDLTAILNYIILNKLIIYDIKMEVKELFEKCFIYVDGYRQYNEISSIVPKQTVLICFEKKAIRIPDIVSNIKRHVIKKCNMCNNSNKIIYIENCHNLFLCKECFCEWFEEKVFRRLDAYIEKKLPQKIAMAASGEKDSAVAMYLTVSYFEKFKIEIPLKVISIHDGLTTQDKALEFIKETANQKGLDFEVIYSDKFDKTKVAGGTESSLFNYTLTEIYNSLPLNLKHQICDYHSIRTGAILKSFFSEGFEVITGFSLTDYFRFLFDKTREEKTSKDYLYPLADMTDEEICIYSTIKKIDYHVEDCPFKSTNFTYNINLRRQYIDYLLPGCSRMLVENAKYTEIK